MPFLLILGFIGVGGFFYKLGLEKHQYPTTRTPVRKTAVYESWQVLAPTQPPGSC